MDVPPTETIALLTVTTTAPRDRNLLQDAAAGLFQNDDPTEPDLLVNPDVTFRLHQPRAGLPTTLVGNSLHWAL